MTVRQHVRYVAIAVGVLCLGGAGSSTTHATKASALPASLAAFEPAPIEWTTIAEGIEEGWLEVPIDYSDPSGGTLRLYLVRHLATDEGSRIGSMVVNPGGPGFGGTIHAQNAAMIFGEELVEHFDIVGWDPRGTGRSEPVVDCIDNYDKYLAGTDVTPDDDGERQQLIEVAADFAARCGDNNGDILPFVGTNSSARDIDAIRRALGEDEISYLGFSYGSELGGAWATLFPETVRAAVLDSAADPTLGRVERQIEQAVASDAMLATFLAACSDSPTCPFHNDGDAEGAFDELMSAIDDSPLPTVAGRPRLTRGMALDGVAEAMYGPAFWPHLARALAAAQLGDGGPLLGLHDSYYQRQADGSWDNSLEAYRVITCMDGAERLSVPEEAALAQRFVAAAPRLGLSVHEPYECTFFPDSTDPRVEITGRDAGPIVVCAASGDPVTPLQGSRAMAEVLDDGRLVIVDADQHTCYGVDPCADTLIEEYLVNLTAPPELTEC